MLKWLVAVIALVVVGYLVYHWWDDRNYYKGGELENFKVRLGDSFQFELDENGSTGSVNCWINSDKCKSVAFVDKTFSPNFHNRLGYIGAGGRTTFIFKSIKTGTDTIAIKNCPVAREHKVCANYTIDSVEPDNIFIVKVH